MYIIEICDTVMIRHSLSADNISALTTVKNEYTIPDNEGFLVLFVIFKYTVYRQDPRTISQSHMADEGQFHDTQVYSVCYYVLSFLFYLK